MLKITKLNNIFIIVKPCAVKVARRVYIRAFHINWTATKLKNMITGANQMEGVILVVSATDGVQVQTREHVILAKEIGIPYMVVFLNKVDVVKDSSMVDLIELEIRELIESYGFSPDTPVIRGSAKKALEGDSTYTKTVLELMNSVDSFVQSPKRQHDAPFLMPIETVLVAQGRGTVVTGKVERGTLKVGDEIELVGKNVMKTICMGIETYRRILDSAEPGDNVGILLKNIPNKDVYKGYVACAVGTMKCYTNFIAKVYILSQKEGGRSKPFTTGYKPQFFFRVSNVTGSITLDNPEQVVVPGDTVTFKVTLIEKSVINEGLRFIIREGKITIGAGIILKTID